MNHNKKEDGRAWTGLIGLGQEKVVGYCGHSNKPLASTKFREILHKPRKYSLLKKDTAPQS
jgi:hypothetical protein